MILFLIKYYSRYKLKKYIQNRKYSFNLIPENYSAILYVTSFFSKKEKPDISNNELSALFHNDIKKNEFNYFSHEVDYLWNNEYGKQKLKPQSSSKLFDIEIDNLYSIFILFQKFNIFGENYYFIKLNFNLNNNNYYFFIEKNNITIFSNWLFDNFFEFSDPKFRVEHRVNNF